MQEAEWLTSEDPGRMLAYLFPVRDEDVGLAKEFRPSNRKMRLFACACVRRLCTALSPEELVVLRVTEGMADGIGLDEDLYDAHRRERLDNTPPRNIHEAVLLSRCAANYSWSGDFVARQVIEYAPVLGNVVPLAGLLRDIVGNPWLHHPEAGAWLTPTVLAIARTAYEERGGWACDNPYCGPPYRRTRHNCEVCKGTGRTGEGFLDPARLLVLSDALEEAGCAEKALLRHLRGWKPCPQCRGRGTSEDGGWDCGPCNATGWIALHGPHARGCHVVDLILGLR